MQGPVQVILIDPGYLDVSMPSGTAFTQRVQPEYTVFAYGIEGQAYFDAARQQQIGIENVVIFDKGDEVTVSTEADRARFLLISGKPLNCFKTQPTAVS